MSRIQMHVAAIEIPHSAGANADRTHGQAGLLSVQGLEIDQFVERSLERLGRVEGSTFEAKREIDTPRRSRIKLKEAREALNHRLEIGQSAAEQRPEPPIIVGSPIRDSAPEF